MRISLVNDKRFRMPPKEVASDEWAGRVAHEPATRRSACPPLSPLGRFEEKRDFLLLIQYQWNVVCINGNAVVFGIFRWKGEVTDSASVNQGNIYTRTFATSDKEYTFLAQIILNTCCASRIASLHSSGVPKPHNRCWRLSQSYHK